MRFLLRAVSTFRCLIPESTRGLCFVVFQPGQPSWFCRFFYFLALKGDKVFRNFEKKLVIRGGINSFVKTALDNQL